MRLFCPLCWNAATDWFFALCHEFTELTPLDAPAGLRTKLGVNRDTVWEEYSIGVGGATPFNGVKKPPIELIFEPGVLLNIGEGGCGKFSRFGDCMCMFGETAWLGDRVGLAAEKTLGERAGGCGDSWLELSATWCGVAICGRFSALWFAKVWVLGIGLLASSCFRFAKDVIILGNNPKSEWDKLSIFCCFQFLFWISLMLNPCG